MRVREAPNPTRQQIRPVDPLSIINETWHEEVSPFSLPELGPVFELRHACSTRTLLAATAIHQLSTPGQGEERESFVTYARTLSILNGLSKSAQRTATALRARLQAHRQDSARFGAVLIGVSRYEGEFEQRYLVNGRYDLPKVMDLCDKRITGAIPYWAYYQPRPPWGNKVRNATP